MCFKMNRSKSAFGFDEDYAYRELMQRKFVNSVIVENARSVFKRAGIARHVEVHEPIVEVAQQPLFKPTEGFYRKFEVGATIARESNGTLVWGIMDDDFFLFKRMWRNDDGEGLSDRQANPRRIAFYKAGSLAKDNAFSIMRELAKRGIFPLAFFYSELPLLLEQIEWFKDNADAFRTAYNESLLKHRARGESWASGMKLMEVGELPLWRINDDGSKETLKQGEATPLRVGFKAVARNLAFASFLQSWTYVSGKGAAESYGVVAHDVAKALSVKEPIEVIA